MWIVRLALRRPYTFVVMAVLIAFLERSRHRHHAGRYFPLYPVRIPASSASCGSTPASRPKRWKSASSPISSAASPSNVNDIEHIESQSYNGIAVVQIYFHPNVRNRHGRRAGQLANEQRHPPDATPGMLPGSVLKYDALASVPILQLCLSSKTMREQEIFDLGNNFIRTPLRHRARRGRVPYPFGGKARAVMVDLNLDELYAKAARARHDVSNALNLQGILILPAGTAKLAGTEYQIRVNSSPIVLNELNNLPIKTVNGATVYMKDVAQVRDGFSVQNNIVRTNGSRGVLMSITRTGKASTLDIVNDVQAALTANSRHHPAGAESHHARRPVPLRPRLHQRRGARSPDRRRPHRHDDPALSRQLAQHVNRLYLDSAVDPGLHLHHEA